MSSKSSKVFKVKSKKFKETLRTFKTENCLSADL